MPFLIKSSQSDSHNVTSEKEDDITEISDKTAKLGAVEAEDHRQRILASFNCYQSCQLERINGKEVDYKMLPGVYAGLIPQFPKKFKTMEECISQNKTFLNRISTHPLFPGESSFPSEFHTHNVRSVLQQCVRDWAEEGAGQRTACYGPVLKAIKALYTDRDSRKGIKVLDPGCCLGRLVYELADLGFTTTGIEISNLKFLCSDVITSQLAKDECWIYPYVDQVTNQWSFDNQSRGIRIPHIDTSKLTRNNPRYSVRQGDFSEVCKEPNCYDVIVTCFFLDTAVNLLDHLKVISFLLKPGGYFINMGPLIYSMAGMYDSSPSVELTYEELKSVLPCFGLEMIVEEKGLEASYIEDNLSMLRMRYSCVHFVCQKSESTPTGANGGLIHNPNEKKIYPKQSNVEQYAVHETNDRPRDHWAIF